MLSLRLANLLPRYDYRAASSKIDAELYQFVYEFWKEQAIAAQESSGANMTFVLQHIPKNVVDKGKQNGGNSLGIEPIAQQCQYISDIYRWDPSR
jgi:hypothetical protein